MQFYEMRVPCQVDIDLRFPSIIRRLLAIFPEGYTATYFAVDLYICHDHIIKVPALRVESIKKEKEK